MSRPIATESHQSGEGVGLEEERIHLALLIREVEERFLQLFSEGKLNGTVHTCVGQEFSAVAVAGQLDPTDFVFSNHRCHGHYIAFTGDYKGLIAELLGKSTGTCGGIGSSQHLCRNGFFSNGVQGGIVPVAAGMAMSLKLQGKRSIGAVFIGDGTLGEGTVYESLNLISKLEIPLLVVCEDNGFAQLTPNEVTLAGRILDRPRAFGIETFEGTTDDPASLMEIAKEAISTVRDMGKPAFLLVRTARLNPHSKGDDTRSEEELAALWRRDYLSNLAEASPEFVGAIHAKVEADVSEAVEECLSAGLLSVEDYLGAPQAAVDGQRQWRAVEPLGERLVKRINRFFEEKMASDERLILIGEDIVAPYGGAFKVTQGLSDQFPERVLSTPISEAGIVGLGNGLALTGMKPFVEIMFGDFITLALDQIINHASKFHHMYNRQVTCPVVIRTPMGGRRGYGPTHSQTLDAIVCGLPNVRVVALNTFTDPFPVLEQICQEEHPVILIENKTDYGRKVGPPLIGNYETEISNDRYPMVRIRPLLSVPQVTVITYGGMGHVICEALPGLFATEEILAEVFVLSQISPFETGGLIESIGRTRRVVVVEEGGRANGVGSEIVSSLMEAVDFPFRSLRIGSAPVPIPSPPELENKILPTAASVSSQIAAFCRATYVGN